MEWFKAWFNSPYYHLLYRNRDNNEAKLFLLNILNKINIPKEAELLDLACGKGRHSLYLNTLGYKVTGIDLSEESILYTKQFENENLKFEVGDMRISHFANRFQVVFNLFTSLGYFENEDDNIQVLKAIKNQLQEQGLFIFDYFNDEYVINNLIPYEEKLIDSILFKITKSFTEKHILKDIVFETENKTFHFQEKVQRISPKKMITWCNKEGLKPIESFGNYNLESFNHFKSPRFIQIFKSNGK